MSNDIRIPLARQTGGGGGAAFASARGVFQGQVAPARALYIHTPFCVHKCHYCDFYSFVDTRDQQAAFVDRLARELGALAPHAGPLRTVFIGGGTPSLLRVDLWRRLLARLRACMDLGPADDFEFTVECNPESVSADLMSVLAQGGVNRVSIGAQSFHAGHLRTLERRHDPENVARALGVARAGGIARTSIDLIYAVPGQTFEECGADLDRALALGTDHVSCYNLTYEANTPMAVRLHRGEFTPVGDDLEADMFELIGARLAAAGLERYEVSNYARPGQECRHNLAYWRQEPWLAAGPSASGHAWAGPQRAQGGHRWKNVPSLGVYLERDDAGYAPVQDHELPDPRRAIRERLMTGARLAEGIDAPALLADLGSCDAGAAACDRLLRAARALGDEGWLSVSAQRWTIAPRGWLLADWVAKRLMGAV